MQIYPLFWLTRRLVELGKVRGFVVLVGLSYSWVWLGRAGWVGLG